MEKAQKSHERAVKLLSDFRQPTRALTLITEAIAILPRNSKLYLARAQVYRMLGRNQLAFCDLNSVLRLEPQMNRAYALCVWWLARSSPPAAALRPACRTPHPPPPPPLTPPPSPPSAPPFTPP